MDRFNLLWLMRYRFSYGLSPARAFYLLSSTGSQLHSEQLMKLAKLDSLASMISECPASIQQLLQGQQDLFHIELLMELHLVSAARSNLTYASSQVSRSFAYLILREAQTRFILAILKGKKLGFDQGLIAEALGVAV
jgi:V/A-type H+-transporting ATPase subunit C